MLDQERLEAIEVLRRAQPQCFRLIDERGEHHESDHHDGGHDDHIDGENREYPAQRAPAGCAVPRMLDQSNEGRESHRDECADVDDHQDVARFVHYEQADGDGCHREHGAHHAPGEVLVAHRVPGVGA